MRKQLTIALLCIAGSTPVFSEVGEFNIAANQKLPDPAAANPELAS